MHSPASIVNPTADSGWIKQRSKYILILDLLRFVGLIQQMTQLEIGREHRTVQDL